MERVEAAENAGYPSREAADRAEVQQELRYTESAAYHKTDQIGICNGIAQKRKQEIGYPCPNINALSFILECCVCLPSFIIQLFDPRAQAEDTNILGSGQIPCPAGEIVHLLLVFRFFITMAVPPFVEAVSHEIADNRCSKHHKD